MKLDEGDPLIILINGDKAARAENLADIIMSLSKTYCVTGCTSPVNGVAPALPSVSAWETRDGLIEFIRTNAKDFHIVFNVFHKHSSSNE